MQRACLQLGWAARAGWAGVVGGQDVPCAQWQGFHSDQGHSNTTVGMPSDLMLLMITCLHKTGRCPMRS